MRIAYLDESGDGQDLPAQSPPNDITPVIVLGAVAFDEGRIEAITREFIELKRRWFPRLVGRGPRRLDRILPEVKGSDLRRAMRAGAPRRNRRQAIGFLDSLIRLLEDHDAQIFGRLWVKEPGEDCNEKSIYGFSVQDLFLTFNQLLETRGDDYGLVIADSRTPGLNASVSHSIFTQKFKIEGDCYPRIIEMPTFGHSQNHAGLQIADLVCSALLFPMATRAYCLGLVSASNVHVDAGFERLTRKFGYRLQRLQHRYEDDHGNWRGGIMVSDPLGHKPGSRLFRV